VIVVGGMLVAFVTGDHVVRALALVVAVSILAYVYTPTSASGIFNAPVIFRVNLRYVFPPLGLGLALAPVALASYRRAITQRAIGVVAAVALAWQRGIAESVATVVVVLMAVLVRPLLPTRLPRPTRRILTVAGTVLAIVTIIGGFFVQRTYLDRRYVGALSERFVVIDPASLDSVYEWARDIKDKRIGIYGTEYQYPLVGLDLSNYVQYIGRHTPHGGFENPASCPGWRAAINAGHYDYVVVVAGPRARAREEAWTRGRNSRPVLNRSSATVFRIDGPLDPGCARK
jgi:hypothetical protein